LCLMAHTDVVPVTPSGWKEDPFGGELIGNEVWGRGAVDMLNLTASMAVAFRHVATSGIRYPGDIIYFAVADEEAGGVFGAGQLVEQQWDALACDYVLTEYGGTPVNTNDGVAILVTTTEKGVGNRRIIIGGEPGHGSMPHGADNALVKAAEVVRRLAEYDPGMRIDTMFRDRVKALGFDQDLEQRLLDPVRHNEALSEIEPSMARNLHACSHTSFSPNLLHTGKKVNIIPDTAVLEVDIRLMPGETQDDVEVHLRTALGPDLFAEVEIEEMYQSTPTQSPTDTPLWHAMSASMQAAYPNATIVPSMVTGGTDARFFREKGIPAYGAGLLSPQLGFAEFLNRFHGHDERIDIESLRLTTQLWIDIMDRLWT
jgi:acetylornithine deacetylase/succinyl-diaminopimelate desuccinylase-like protein